MIPARLQLSRRRGYNLQAASLALNGLPAVKVDRSTRWGNPYKPPAGIRLERAGVQQLVEWYALDLCAFALSLGAGWEDELRDRNLACWCALCPTHAAGKPLGVECADCAPCHADCLLEVSNAEANR
jgi:hypothetical protein